MEIPRDPRLKSKIEAAVDQALDAGYRTGDIMQDGMTQEPSSRTRTTHTSRG